MYDMFLPIVKPDISGPLEHEILNKYDEQYLEEQIARIDEINPMISQWIKQFSKTTEDPAGAAFCGVIIYRMLESQAQANQMTYEDKLAEN